MSLIGICPRIKIFCNFYFGYKTNPEKYLGVQANKQQMSNVILIQGKMMGKN